jgi:hypothetical protein
LTHINRAKPGIPGAYGIPYFLQRVIGRRQVLKRQRGNMAQAECRAYE